MIVTESPTSLQPSNEMHPVLRIPDETSKVSHDTHLVRRDVRIERRETRWPSMNSYFSVPVGLQLIFIDDYPLLQTRDLMVRIALVAPAPGRPTWLDPMINSRKSAGTSQMTT